MDQQLGLSFVEQQSFYPQSPEHVDEVLNRHP